MNPLFYDVGRTLLSKPTIITFAIIVLFALALIPNLTDAGNRSLDILQNLSLLGYYDQNGYHFLGFATDGYGQGIEEVTFQINLTSVSSPVLDYSGLGVTDSCGIARFVSKTPIDKSYNSVTSPEGSHWRHLEITHSYFQEE